MKQVFGSQKAIDTGFFDCLGSNSWFWCRWISIRKVSSWAQLVWFGCKQ